MINFLTMPSHPFDVITAVNGDQSGIVFLPEKPLMSSSIVDNYHR